MADEVSGHDREHTENPPWWPALAALGVLWLFAIRQLRTEWTINPQYTYGWTVPFLAGYLFLERWKNRPPAQSPQLLRAVAFAVLALVLLLLPVRVIQEASPDWRILGWVIGGACAAVSLAAVHFAGGIAWTRHFAFAILFFLVAVPWPVPLEQTLVQWLMRSVTGIVVELLSWFEIPAVQKGNIIEIRTALGTVARVGVEEACSGVRSLQTTLMIALFLGELLRFGIIRRIVLLAGALGVAFVCNAARAFFLAKITAASGPDAVAKWHDNVGMAVLIASLAGVGLFCLVLNFFRPKKIAPEHPDAIPDAAVDPGLLRPAPPPRNAILIALAAWLVVIEITTELWYRTAESRTPPAKAWAVRWPTAQKGFHDVEFSDTTRNILKYTEGRSAAWSDARDVRWAMVFLRWAPGGTSVQLARSHGPEVCLPATGAVMTAELGMKPMQIGSVTLPVRAYTFRAREQTIQVFYALWEQRPDTLGSQTAAEELNVPRRLAAVRAGIRNSGQQAIEIAIFGVTDPAQAEAAARQFLQNVIVP